MKRPANRDLREVYYQPDPNLERLKDLRGEVATSKRLAAGRHDKNECTTSYDPCTDSHYVRFPDGRWLRTAKSTAALQAHREQLEREWNEANTTKPPLEGLRTKIFVGFLLLIVAGFSFGLWIASLP
jgi:hypothetical protein